MHCIVCIAAQRKPSSRTRIVDKSPYVQKINKHNNQPLQSNVRARERERKREENNYAYPAYHII